MKIFKKLVRDKIPEIIAANGEKAVIRTLGENEFAEALLQKLVEEAQEAKQAAGDELKSEIADIYEVIDAMLATKGFSKEEITKIQNEKREKRGGFLQHLFLESVK